MSDKTTILGIKTSVLEMYCCSNCNRFLKDDEMLETINGELLCERCGMKLVFKDNLVDILNEIKEDIEHIKQEMVKTGSDGYGM